MSGKDVLQGQEVTLTRTFSAPRDQVFRAWTDCDVLSQWWGPNDFTNPLCEIDARPGGRMRIDMRSPDGVIYPNTGVFEEIVAPERLVFSTAVVDEHGNALLRDRTTVTLSGLNGETHLTLQARIVEAVPEMAAATEGMEEGWRQSLDRLAASLAQVPRTPPPDPDIARLGALVGTWSIEGREFDSDAEIRGRVRFEWLEGGFFLVQHVDLVHAGYAIKGIEVIGRERKFGESEPGQHIISRFYDNMGNTLDYVYELEGDYLTIWGGQIGSPAAFRGTISPDGNTLTGSWEWPNEDGTTGGYSQTATRISRE